VSMVVIVPGRVRERTLDRTRRTRVLAKGPCYAAETNLEASQSRGMLSHIRVPFRVYQKTNRIRLVHVFRRGAPSHTQQIDNHRNPQTGTNVFPSACCKQDPFRSFRTKIQEHYPHVEIRSSIFSHWD
jgi:hypothetical protein